MSNLTNELRNSAKDMKETANYIDMGADYIDKGQKIAEYWLDANKSKEIRAQVELWRKKESRMTKKYIFLWLIMISGTIYFWIR